MKWGKKKNMKGKGMWLLFFGVLVLCCACSQRREADMEPEAEVNEPELEAQKAPFLLKLATTKIPESDAYQGLEQFKEQVERNSDGSIEVQIYPSEQLGDQSTLFEGLRIGTIEMAFLSVGSAENIFPEVTSIGSLFSWDTEEEAIKAYQSEMGHEVLERMRQATNIRSIGYSIEGIRNIWSQKNLNGIEDFEGIRLWVSETPTVTSAFQSIGGSIISMPMTQVYDGLQAGLLDGIEIDAETVLRYNLQEQCKYCLETQHAMTVYTFFMSDEIFETMTSEQQKIVQEAAEDASQWMQERYMENRTEIREELERKGVVFYQPDEELESELRSRIGQAAEN